MNDAAWKWIVRVAGLAGIVHQAAFVPVTNETLLFLYAAMIGLPQFIRGNGGKK